MHDLPRLLRSADRAGFRPGAIYTVQDLSLVITKGDSNEAVACCDLLEPDADEFVEAGLLLVRLQRVSASDIDGIAVLERATMQQEEDAVLHP